MNPKITREQLLHLVPKRSKYGVKQDQQGKLDRTYKGIQYHSEAEMLYAQQLDILQMAGEIRCWKRQQVYPLWVNGQHVTDYTADFEVYKGHRPPIVVDVKGHQTPESKLKIKLMKAVYGITVQIVTKDTKQKKEKACLKKILNSKRP